MAEFNTNIPNPQHSKAEGLDGIKDIKQTDKSKERIQLGTNSVLNLAVKTIGPDSKQSFISNLLDKHRFVEIKGTAGGQKVLLNVNSAAKRLGITPKEVRILAKGDDAMSKLTEVAKKREEAIAKYSSIISNYTIKRGNIPIGKEALKSTTLLKVIEKGLSLTDLATKAQHITAGSKNRYHFFLEPNFGKLLFVEKQIGQGSFGKVFKAEDMMTRNKLAIKVATSEPKDLLNEKKVLSYLGEHRGIQSNVTTFTNISSKENEKAFYHTELMSGDLFEDDNFIPEFHNLGAGERLKLCGDLLAGLNHLHEHHVGHGDIKPHNCLSKKDENGKPEKFVLSDFGAAINFSDKKSSPSKIVSTNDYKPSDFYTSKNTKERVFKSDVFATTKTIIEVLIAEQLDRYMGKETVKNSKNIDSNLIKVIAFNSPEANKIRDLLLKSNIPSEIADCLIKGLGPKDSRPSANEIFTEYEKILKGTPKENLEKTGKDAYDDLQKIKAFAQALNP